LSIVLRGEAIVEINGGRIMADFVAPVGMKKESFWRRRIASPLLALLRQGATPEKLSLAIALGFVLGIFPVLGTTTVLCVAVAAALRLNQAAAQVGNGVSTLFFIALVIPFVRLGERLTGSDAFPLALDQLREVAKQGAVVLFKTFSVAILHGVLGWIVVAPVVAAVLYFALLPLLRRMIVTR
jgi:uncharacterized protein (DUF2062 family)